MVLSEKQKSSIFFALVAFLGIIAIKLPVAATYIGSISRLCYFVLSGAILGFFNPNCAWRWGIFMGLILFVVSIIGMVIEPASHNLWPIEWLFYAVLMVSGVLGALLGSFLRNKVKGRVSLQK